MRAVIGAAPPKIDGEFWSPWQPELSIDLEGWLAGFPREDVGRSTLTRRDW
ncbi:hypothetical protein [Dactylosporangium sucinum]|uniref:hypothetical protein n=1 Tax=Dactylosporangium sucinum TaxID=1424081 RepID=UPI00167D3E60|nr:hypothetical protein [Dactylosporangium sucinum]